MRNVKRSSHSGRSTAAERLCNAAAITPLARNLPEWSLIEMKRFRDRCQSNRVLQTPVGGSGLAARLPLPLMLQRCITHPGKSMFILPLFPATQCESFPGLHKAPVVHAAIGYGFPFTACTVGGICHHLAHLFPSDPITAELLANKRSCSMY